MSWEQLGSIGQEWAERVQQEESAPPVACWNDGEPVSSGGPGGAEPFCRFCGRRGDELKPPDQG